MKHKYRYKKSNFVVGTMRNYKTKEEITGIFLVDVFEIEYPGTVYKIVNPEGVFKVIPKEWDASVYEIWIDVGDICGVFGELMDEADEILVDVYKLI